MEIELETAAVTELGQVLRSGCVSFDGVRIVYDTLPGRTICGATVVGGILWLAVDLDKASAPRHALAMIHEMCPAVGEGEPVTVRAPLSLVS